MERAEAGNFVLNEREKSVIVSVNPKIYPLPAVFSAAYSLMDRAYAVVDGDKSKRLTVTLWPKGKQRLHELAMLFNQELLNYSVCFNQARETAAVREALIKRAFLGHDAAEDKDELLVKDPLGIANPWQKQKGKKAGK